MEQEKRQNTLKTGTINPNAVMNDIMQTIDRLRDVYVRETEALESANAPAFMDLQDEKVTQARAYQSSMEQILRRKEEMRLADPTLKQKLLAMQADFAQLSEKNLKALEKMKNASVRLGNAIRSSVKENARKEYILGYGETGALNSDKNKPISTGLSETA